MKGWSHACSLAVSRPSPSYLTNKRVVGSKSLFSPSELLHEKWEITKVLLIDTDSISIGNLYLPNLATGCWNALWANTLWIGNLGGVQAHAGAVYRWAVCVHASLLLSSQQEHPDLRHPEQAAADPEDAHRHTQSPASDWRERHDGDHR